MTKELLISSFPHETKVAVLEDDQLVEVYFQRDLDSGLGGGIYKGRVNRVLPGMQSAFVDIGLEKDAFLYVSDFFEDSEEYDRVFTEAENRVAKMNNGGVTAAQPPIAESPGVEGEAIASPAEAEPVAAEVPSEPVQPLLRQDISGAENVGPDPAPSGNSASLSSTSAPPSKDDTAETRRPEFGKRDFPGRRHRRRGHGFRENRFGSRRESSEGPREFHNEGSTKPIEPLPGESLAKYSQPTAENSSEEDSNAGAESGAETAGLNQAALEKFSAVGASAQEDQEPASSQLAPSLVEAADNDGTQGARPEVAEDLPPRAATLPVADVELQPDEVAFAPALAAAEERLIESKETETTEISEGSQRPQSQDELFENGNRFDIADTTNGGDSSQQSVEAGGAESDTPTEAPDGGPPSPQPYTLRDTHHRPRVAPRRGRKGGRGKFSGHQGGRTEGASPEVSRGGNHHPLPISALLKEGQEILVQIAKEPLGTKGARITSHIALPGRYLVYMPTISHIGVSRKIGSDEERLRLRNIILENRGSLTGGFIVRTAGTGRSEEELKADLAFLTNLWNDIRARAERSKAPALLHRDLTLVERILRDLVSPDFKCIRVDNEIEYEHVLDFVNRFQPALVGHVKLYTQDEPLFEEFGVQAELDKALKPKVWLKSGGYIVINQTEALVAIDVNTGKYVGRTNRLEDTIVRTNVDAAMEIVRQIRLRDLGGIIVIDFIDMDERRNRNKVVQALEDALRRDRAPTKILSFNEFGLVALTRKRAKQSLERTLCDPCPYCVGAGWVKSVATVSHEIVAESRKMGSQIDGKVMTLRVNPQVAAHLKSKDGILISEIEAACRKEVVIKGDPAVHQERFEIF